MLDFIDRQIKRVPGVGSVYRGGKDFLRDQPAGALLGLESTAGQAGRELQRGLGQARAGVEAGYGSAGQYYDPYVGMAGSLPGLQERVAGGAYGAEVPGMEDFDFNYQQSPGYQYAVDEALGQTQKGLAARGLAGSGAEQKALTRMASGLALQDYGNQRDRAFREFQGRQEQRMGLANMGQRFGQQQFANELGLGRIGYDALDKRAGLDTRMAELLAQIDVGGAQGLAATQMAKGRRMGDFWDDMMTMGGALSGGMPAQPGNAASQPGSVGNQGQMFPMDTDYMNA